MVKVLSRRRTLEAHTHGNSLCRDGRTAKPARRGSWGCYFLSLRLGPYGFGSVFPTRAAPPSP